MTDNNSIKDRIRKLLAMASRKVGNDGKSNADEADTAMRMAMALMTRHGIEQSSLGGEASKVKMGARASKNMAGYRLDLIHAAAVLYGCRALFYNNGRAGFEFIGRPDNIDAAEQTALWLIRQVGELFKSMSPDYIPKKGEGAKYYTTRYYQYRQRFKAAAAQRVCSRAYDLVNNPASIAAESGSTALVVGDYFKTLAAENEEFLSSCNIKKMEVKHPTGGEGTNDGIRAGNMVKLRREVGA